MKHVTLHNYKPDARGIVRSTAEIEQNGVAVRGKRINREPVITLRLCRNALAWYNLNAHGIRLYPQFKHNNWVLVDFIVIYLT
jgi:hypothetical protein